MTLFQLQPTDRLNYNGQIYRLYADEKDSSGNIIKRIFKRYHDNRRAEFMEDKEVELFGAHNPGATFFYKLKDIQWHRNN